MSLHKKPDEVATKLHRIAEGVQRFIDLISNPPQPFQYPGEIIVKITANVTFTVEPPAPPPITVAPTQDLGPADGPLLETKVAIDGGTPPYTVALDPSSGPLPPGVILGPDGSLSGTATAAGSFPVILDVADSLG